MAELLIIMVVEDDLIIQLLVEETLSGGRLEALVVSSGEKAVELLDASGAKYRALATDRTSEEKSWMVGVARRAREIEPEFSVVSMTGDSAVDWASDGFPDAPTQLLTAVSQLLNAGTPTA